MIDRGVRLLLVLLVLLLGAACRAGAATFVDEGDGIAVTDDDPPADPDEADDPQDEDTAEGDDADGAEAEDEAAEDEADVDADDADQADADEAESADADDADADTDDAGADDAHADEAAEDADEADSDDADEAGADDSDADDDASEADDPEAAEAGDASDSDTAEAASAANEDAGSSGAAPTTDEVPPPPPPPPPPDAAGPPKFGYELEVDGEVMQFQEVSGLDFEAQAIEYRDENSPTFSNKKKPGIGKHSAITLTRGTFVKANKLLDWFATKTTVARKSVTIRLLDESGTPTMVWLVINAWPTQVSGASESAVKTVVLEHEGLEVPKLQPR